MPRLKNHKLASAKKPTRTKAATAKAKGPAKSYIFTQAIGEQICQRIAEGESVRAISRSPGMPGKSTIVRWGLDADHPFAGQFARACEVRAHLWAEESLEIADDGTNDYMERAKEEGVEVVVDHDHISRSRLRIETRKWILSKVLPKIYGDKIQMTGKDEGPIQHQVGLGWMTKEEAQGREWA